MRPEINWQKFLNFKVSFQKHLIKSWFLQNKSPVKITLKPSLFFALYSLNVVLLDIFRLRLVCFFMSKLSSNGANWPGFCFCEVTELRLFIRGSPSGLDLGLCIIGGNKPRLARYSFFVMATAGKFRLNEVLKIKGIYLD